MHKQTVLIVEDDSDFRELLAESLQLEGWTPVLAAGRDEAIRLAKTVAVDVVLADVLLPGGTGTALEESFKADPGLAGVPFVFMTGSAPYADQVGRQRALLKPFQIPELCALLATAARQQSPARRIDVRG